MGKKASFRKNPLTIAFGKVLKKMRNIVGKDTGSIAREIHISDSYYRLVEAGTNNLAVSNSLDLVNAFNELKNPLSYQGTVSLLSAISIMEVHAKQGVEEGFKYGDGLNRKAKELCLYEQGSLAKLINRFIDKNLFLLVDETTPEDISDIISEKKLDNEAYEFLTDNKYYGITIEEKEEKKLWDLINNAPTLYLDIALTTLKNLTELPVNVFPDYMYEWEESNKEIFKTLHIYMEDADVIISEDNLTQYQYPFLWEDSFDKIFVIYNNSTHENPTQEFFKNLKKALKKNLFSQEIKEKVSFIETTSKQKDELINSLSSNSREFKNWWVWTLNNGRIIGFGSNFTLKTIKSKQQVPKHILTYEEARNIRKKLLELSSNSD